MKNWMTLGLAVVLAICTSPLEAQTAAAVSRLSVNVSSGGRLTAWGNFADSKGSYPYLSGGSFVIAGQALKVGQGNSWSADVTGKLVDGQSYPYEVIDPSGKKATGSFLFRTLLLKGATVSPDLPGPEGPLAASYTVTPPSGGWPTGSYLGMEWPNGSFNPAFVSGTEPFVVDAKSTYGTLGKQKSLKVFGQIVSNQALDGLVGTFEIWGERTYYSVSVAPAANTVVFVTTFAGGQTQVVAGFQSAGVNYPYLPGGSVSIAGIPLALGEGNQWFGDVTGTFKDGATYSYEIVDPAGKKANGSFVFASKTVTGATVSPDLAGPGQKLASSYTINPPLWGWPTGTSIGVQWGDQSFQFFPVSGAKSLVIDDQATGGNLSRQSMVSFYGIVQSSVPLVGLPGLLQIQGAPTYFGKVAKAPKKTWNPELKEDEIGYPLVFPRSEIGNLSYGLWSPSTKALKVTRVNPGKELVLFTLDDGVAPTFSSAVGIQIGGPSAPVLNLGDVGYLFESEGTTYWLIDESYYAYYAEAYGWKLKP